MASAPRGGAVAKRPAAPSAPDTAPEHIIGDFTRGKEIGKGSFATVYIAKHVVKQSYAAVKVVLLSKLTKKLKENLDLEINILKSLQHPHIVALFACIEGSSHMYLVMEYCQLADLSHFMKKRQQLATLPETSDYFRRYPNQENGGIHEVLARHFMKQIVSALEYLRSRNLIHRDIKPQNLLLTPSPRYMTRLPPEDIPLAASASSLVPTAGINSLPMVKLADFGFARHLPSTAMAETLCGSPLYMAPEILRYEKYDARADLWSTGAVLYEMVVGKPPFRAQNHVELLRRIEKANDIITFDRNLPVSREMKNTIRSLLKKSPAERVSYERLFQDPLVTGPIPGLVAEDRPITPAAAEAENAELVRKTAKQVIDTAAAAAAAPEEQPRVQTRPSQEQLASRTARKSSDQDLKQHQAVDMGRRKSSSGSQNNPGQGEIRRQPSQREQRRPSIVGHATAPARQDLHVTAPRIERRASRSSPLAGPPMVREMSGTELSKGADRHSRVQRERTAQDVADEREYVLVDGNHVKVNAIADEFEANAVRAQPGSTAVVRRAQGSDPPSPSRGTQLVGRLPHQRNPSFDRRYGAASPQSATNMLTKALNAANARLFGALGTSPPFAKGTSPPIGYAAFPTYTAQGAIAFGDAPETKAPMDEDTRIVRTMEEAAHRSDVVFGFAEVKLRQLLPATPSTQDALGIQQLEDPERALRDSDEEERDMTTVAIVGVAEEALVLYVKTLGILHKTIDLAGWWWNKNGRGEALLSANAATRTSGSSDITKRLNSVVQWARVRYNECLEKCEVVGRRLIEAQRKLPDDHPAHPSNHAASSGSAGTISASSGDNYHLISGVTAEKLMYERAVEMSRAAAVNELVGEELQDCELGYRTAIMLFEGVLETDDEPLMRKPSAKSNKAGDEPIKGVEGEERQTVIKLIEGARARLHALRKKLAHAQANQVQPSTALAKRNSSASTSPAPRPASAKALVRS